MPTTSSKPPEAKSDTLIGTPNIDVIAANIKSRIAELDQYVRLATAERETLVRALGKMQPESTPEATPSGG